MKKTVLSLMAAFAIIFGGAMPALADNTNSNTCTPCNETCAPAEQANCGFQTIGNGIENAAEGSYNVVKEGTVNTYNKVANGTVNAYDKTKEGTVNAYETVKEGTVNAYEKTKEGTVNLWDKTKAAIHKATE